MNRPISRNFWRLFWKDEAALFVAAMWWRIVYGVLRVLLGLSLIPVVGRPIGEAVRILMHHELIEDPQDILLQMAFTIAGHAPYAVTWFLIIYFVFWGVADIFLSINLLLGNRWAYPITIGALVLFVCYEWVRFLHNHSMTLLWVILVDVSIIMLVAVHYRRTERIGSFSE